MIKAAEMSFRRLGAAVAIAFLASSVACEPRSFSPESTVQLRRPAVMKVPRARVIEAGDRRNAILPGADLELGGGIEDLINTAFDATANRVWIIETRTQQLLEMSVGRDGAADRSTMRVVDARPFGLRGPRGLTVDPASGQLFVLDVGPRIVRIEPHPAMGFRSAIVSVIDLAPAGLGKVRGIAFDATDGHLHILEPRAQRLHEIDQAGQIVATRDVSEFELDDINGMVVAASGDATDDPSEMGIYLDVSGGITELSLSEPTFSALATAATATLVRTTATSGYSPPSPDPSGLAYAAHLGSLVIVDGEVDEMSIYAGANAFEATTSGTFTRAWATTSFSSEPVGAAYNPVNRHLFISDDDLRRIFEIDPGPDGRYRTSDDRMTSFDTRTFGNEDPEGLAYDVAQGVLFIADGLNAQVFRLSPGANGVFDGGPPSGDDQATSFDTQVHGLVDPEGIAYDSDFGHIYVSGKPSTQVYQYSTTGTLMGTIDVSAANADKLSGLEYVAGAAGAGTRTLYIVDRNVDNDSDPNENDGRLYQFSLVSGSGNRLPTVAITAPADGAIFVTGATVTFTGTANDAEDGNLAASIAWRSSRDGSLGSGGSVSSSTLSEGTHTITASVTDAAGARATASITVTVNSPGAANAVLVRVAASADDAEEAATGSVSLSSSDLEMAFSGTSNQATGMRFNGIAVPPGATITRAYVQFQVDEVSTDVSSLTISGHAADNATVFTTAKFNVSSRPRTTSTVAWSPPGWATVNQAGANQQTPSLIPIVQEIVNRPGWRSGNSLALIVTGTGRRVAEAFDGVVAAAPLLRVEYSVGPNTVPTATNVTITGTPQVGRVLTGSYTYSDANGDSEGASTYRWFRNGAVISGASARTYTVLAADEGAMIAFEVTPVAASGESPGATVQSAAVGPVAAPPPNSAPVATNVNISGTAQVGQVLAGNYTYGDVDGDPEGTSSYRWLRDGAPISGATARTYTLVTADQGRLIRFEVTPAASSGASPGAPVQSANVGPVTGAGTAVAVQVRVAASADDAEEGPTGSVSLSSSDLEMAFNGTANQTIGMRFNGVAVPKGATITRAYVQFQVDEVSTDASSLTIAGQAADNAAVFTTVKTNVSSRSRTASTVAWSPVGWATTNQAGVDQQTPSLISIVQEIVNRPGWQSGNSLALIVTGTGRRVAEAFDGVPAAAPLLRIEYTVGSPTP